jgi:transcriptional regulator with XRE-family HTH domain
MQTIGERLEDARKKKGVSIREAADLTKIRGEYLQKFEGNQFDLGLSEIYVRGFLRNYAHFLHLPADRLLNDYGALVRKESRPRAPSREVYGRMDLSISSADAAEPAPAPVAAAAEPGDGPGRPPPRFPRPGVSLPKAPPIDPAVVLRMAKWGSAVVVALLLVWAAKALFSGGSPAASPKAEPIAAAGAPEAAAPVTLIALAPLQVKVARQADGQELYQGPMARNERRDFPNIGLWITSYTVESLRIEYKGALYEFPGQKGHARVPLPPFPSKP